MPRSVDQPEGLRAATFWLQEDPSMRGDEGLFDCPWCERQSSNPKMSVNATTGLGRCLACGYGSKKGGMNVVMFLRALWDRAEESTTDDDLRQFAEERGLDDINTLKAWGVRKSHVGSQNWVIPGYNVSGNLIQLYRYVPLQKKSMWLPTPNGAGISGHGFHAAVPCHGLRTVGDKADDKITAVDICEGPGDGMAWWETLRGIRLHEGLHVSTSNEDISLWAKTEVIAVPGCGNWHEPWGKLCSGRDVSLLFDSDHPRGNGLSPGYEGMKRTTQLLSQYDPSATSIKFMNWGTTSAKGYDPDLKDGFDIKDALTSAQSKSQAVQTILPCIQSVPAEWIPGRSALSIKKGEPYVAPEKCSDWRTYLNALRLAMKLTPGMEKTISVMFATAASVGLTGEVQLWTKVVSPPSGGKTTLAEAISVARKYVYPIDTMSNIVSGYQESKEGARDKGLVTKIRDKCLIIKDGDTLLNEGNMGKILSNLRALFDRALRSHWGNDMSKNHEDHNCGIILCGTASLRTLDTSELGERFLTVRIMEEINEDLEREINMRKLRGLRANWKGGGATLNGKGADSPEMVAMKRLAGGYVNWLRENIGPLVEQLDVSDDVLDLLEQQGRFVAYMRSRQSKKQTEEVHRELSTRLVQQFWRMANCVAVVRNRKELDGDVMDICQSVCHDSCQGRTRDVVDTLWKAGDDGENMKGVSVMIGEGEVETTTILRFLQKIRVVETYNMSLGSHQRPVLRWRLTPTLNRLYSNVATENPYGDER